MHGYIELLAVNCLLVFWVGLSALKILHRKLLNRVEYRCSLLNMTSDSRSW